MRWSILEEIKGKLLHIAIILLVTLHLLLRDSVSQQISLFTLVFILLFLMAAEYIRLEMNVEVPIIKQILRSREERRMHGVIYFLTATIICLAVFEFKIAIAALLMTVFGSMAATIVTNKFGKTLIFKNKTVKGAITQFIVNVVLGLIILQNIYLIIAMAATATIIETMLSELDDNLFIPLFAGFAGQLIFFII
ncbi:MAG: hypothetical protein KKC54_08695 [Nanoarchaeota archaeon]|nr:hypothetical protein [Nanoarchaeota archaeon]